MHSITALRNFRSKALDGESFPVRYAWSRTGHTEAAVATMWAELADLVPAGATHILDLGCGNGGFAKVLRKKKPGVAYTGVDLVIENIETAQADCQADGTVTCATVATADTVTINGVALTASGSQTGSGLDFDETAGSDENVAASLVAAINDAGNGLNGTVTAANVGAVVTVTAVTPGTAGNALTLASSSGTTLAVEAATLTGGVDPSDFKVQGVWDALGETTPAWDFAVSCNCAWAFTDHRKVQMSETSLMLRMDCRTLLFDLLNAKATKGFAVLARRDRLPRDLAGLMTAARAASTNLGDSYYEAEGARTTLLIDLVGIDLTPVWLHRDDVTGVESPAVPPSLCITDDAYIDTAYNPEMSDLEARRAHKAGDPAPTTFKGLAVGRVITSGLAVITE